MNSARLIPYDRHDDSSRLGYQLKDRSLCILGLRSRSLSRSDHEEPGDRTCSRVWDSRTCGSEEVLSLTFLSINLKVTLLS